MNIKPTIEVVIGPAGFIPPTGLSKVKKEDLKGGKAAAAKEVDAIVKAGPKVKVTAKKAVKAKAPKKAKGTKEGTWFKGPTRKVSIAKITQALKAPKTIMQLAKLLDVSHTGAQNYIRDVKKAGVKLERKNTRQGKRGPLALTFQVTA